MTPTSQRVWGDGGRARSGPALWGKSAGNITLSDLNRNYRVAASLTNFSKVARVNVANDAGDDVAFWLNSADDGDFLLQLASAADRPHQCPFGSGCTQPSASA